MLAIRNEAERMTFPEKQKLRELITLRLVLKKCYREFFTLKEKNSRHQLANMKI
jgi:hypothetical protein